MGGGNGHPPRGLPGGFILPADKRGANGNGPFLHGHYYQLDSALSGGGSQTLQHRGQDNHNQRSFASAYSDAATYSFPVTYTAAVFDTYTPSHAYSDTDMYAYAYAETISYVYADPDSFARSDCGSSDTHSDTASDTDSQPDTATDRG
jgi:hypothetical protein